MHQTIIIFKASFTHESFFQKSLLKVNFKILKSHVTAPVCAFHVDLYQSLLLKVTFTKQNMFYFVKFTFESHLLSKVDCLHWRVSCESQLLKVTFQSKRDLKVVLITEP